MSLISAKEMYQLSFEKNFFLGAFNIFNLETLQAVVSACEETGSPAIVQIAPGNHKYIKDLPEFVVFVKAILAKSKIPFVLHHDHISKVEDAKRILDIGIHSIMFDGSHLPYEENIVKTREVVEYGKQYDAFIEAELGSIPGFEDDIFAECAEFTKPETVNDFIDRSGCGSLAISVGTAHGGVLTSEHLPLNIELLKTILAEREGYPFVLHGAASMPAELIEDINKYGGTVPDYRICSEENISLACKNGIKKVNMDVDNFLCFNTAVRKHLLENSQQYDPRPFLSAGRDAFKNEVIHKLQNVTHSTGVID